MKRYLITGISGVGESAVSRALASMGYSVIETDIVPGNKHIYRRRFDKRTGTVSAYRRGEGWNELRHVEWRIDLEALRADLASSGAGVQFICGYANNWGDMQDDFDRIFLLEASEATIKNRLLNRTSGDWGRKYPEELKHAIETAHDFNNSIKQLGAVEINAEKPVDEIVAELLTLIGLSTSSTRLGV